MASKIKIKSAQTAATPNGILDRGELAFTYSNNKLWVGNINGATNAEIQVGGEITAAQADITSSSIKIPTGKAVYDYVASAVSGSTSLATSSTVGIAKFNTASFSVDVAGDVTIKSAGVSNTQLANSSVTIGSTSVSLGGTAATISGLTLTNPTLNVGSGTLVLPASTTPAQTADGSISWDSDDDVLTVGTGTARKTLVNTDNTQTLTNKTLDSTNTIQKSPVITLGGDLSGSVTLTNLGDGTLTATIAANSVALGTNTTGNYIATIAGTTNQVSVSGSGSETAAVTLSLPQNIHSGASPTFAGVTLDAITVGVSTANTITTSSGNLVLDSTGGTVSINDNLTVSGNLTVQGTTITVNSTVVTIEDPILILGSINEIDTFDRGIAFKYKNDAGTTNFEGFFGWDRSEQAFVFKIPNTAFDEGDGVIAGTTLGNAKFQGLTVNSASVFGNITSTNTGVSSIDGFVIDGGTF